ncbi:hypothetical protein G7046_g6711 [Stylonectria norvegica]|nr:hypothetical protein G7046_g6711 [Stylonectria norvegica]
MDAMRGLNASLPGGAGKQPALSETPEQLLDVFKQAALSVTKLYKTSALAQSKARSYGYQDCLDDLLSFLDKQNMGLDDGEGWKIRRWATERLDGRDNGSQSLESEDEVERAETASSPELTRTSSTSQLPTQLRTDSAPPSVPPIAEVPDRTVVPTQEHFTFQSAHAYPNIATLDLSDPKPHDGPSMAPSRSSKTRLNGSGVRSGPEHRHILDKGLDQNAS